MSRVNEEQIPFPASSPPLPFTIQSEEVVGWNGYKAYVFVKSGVFNYLLGRVLELYGCVKNRWKYN